MIWLSSLILGLFVLLCLQQTHLLRTLRELRRETQATRRVLLSAELLEIGEPLRGDPEFVRMLGLYRSSPRELSPEDRIRARSWNRVATRVYGLALSEPDGEGLFLPAMGEHHKHPADTDLPSIDQLTDLDPEYLALVDALRTR